jgi:hypothetical protein
MIGRGAAGDHFLLIVMEKAYMNRGLSSQDMSVWVEQLRVVTGGWVMKWVSCPRRQVLAHLQGGWRRRALIG